MVKENLYEPFEIEFRELDELPRYEHKHTFFELVYIVSGSGTQCINKHSFSYHAGHMFLITPEDCHSFTISSTTQFFFIRFNDIYIRNSSLHADNREKLEFILQHANHQPGCILRNQTDKSLVKPVVEAIVREYVNRDVFNRELIQQLVNTLIVVVARNIAKYLPQEVNEATDEKALDILQYIQQHIYNPDKLRTTAISKAFGVSASYLGRYFKKHANETMQQYINNYKLKLIESRLLHSDLRINEIVTELGFTDESHLNKFFRKYKGISPTQFRSRKHKATA